MNCPQDACSYRRLYCIVKNIAWPCTSDYLPCQARRVGTCWLCSTPLHPSPVKTFSCTFVLSCIRAKFILTLVPTCDVSPHSVSLLLTCFLVFSPPLHLFACSFRHEALNFSSASLDSLLCSYNTSHGTLVLSLLKATGIF